MQYYSNGAVDMDRPRRNFNPRRTRRYGRQTFEPTYLVRYSPKYNYARLYNFPYPGSHWQPRMRTIVMSVDGGSRGNKRDDPKSKAAYGVFFGPDCHRNAQGLLPPDVQQTGNRAELESVRQALLIVQSMKQAGEIDGWREVIIKLDSDYVAKSLGDYIWGWERNGYITRKNTPVEHGNVFKEVHGMICDIERDGAVRFWRVPRDQNTDADALVNQALDDAADSGYDES